MKPEHVAPVGYINEDKQHVMVSVYNPAIINQTSGWVQMVLSIEGGIVLRDELNAFLKAHSATKADENPERKDNGTSAS